MRLRAGGWGVGAALLLAVACREREPTPQEGPTPEIGGRGDVPQQVPSLSGIDFDTAQEVVGQVEDVDPQGLVVSEAGERRLRLKVDSRTQVTMDGRPARVTDLQEGSQVRALYQGEEGGAPTAVRIEATSPAQRD